MRFGATVTVADVDSDEETTYQLVGPYEADITKKKISVQSPLGRALIGKDLIGASVGASPFVGIGVRHLSNGTTGNYDFRTDQYLYLPVGLTVRTSPAPIAMRASSPRRTATSTRSRSIPTVTGRSTSSTPPPSRSPTSRSTG